MREIKSHGAKRGRSSKQNQFIAKKRIAPALSALVLVLILAAWNDKHILMRYPVAVGLDGYYYCLQTRELLAHGRLYFPTHTPLLFYAMSFLAKSLGKIVDAVEMTAILLDLLLALGLFSLVSIVTESLWLGVLASALVASSTLHFYFAGEFIKNLGSIVLLVWSACAIVAGLKSMRRGCFVLAAIFGAGALATHLSVLILIPFLAGIILALRYIVDEEVSKRAKSMIGLLLFLVWLAPAILSWQTLVEVPAWLRAELLTGAEFPIHRIGWSDKTVVLLLVPFAFAFLAAFRRELRKSPLYYVLGATVLWALLITLNPFFNHELGSEGINGRLSELVYLQSAILIPCFIKLSSVARSKIPWIFTCLLSPLIVTASLAPLPHGLQSQYLKERSELAKNLVSESAMIRAKSLVLAPHGDEFLITYITGVESRHLWSYMDDSSRTLWLLRVVSPQSLTPSMVVLLNDRAGAMVLVCDSDLRREMLSLSLPARANLTSRNQHLYAAIHGITNPDELNRNGDIW